MFFGLSRQDFSRSRIRAALPILLRMVMCLVLLLAGGSSLFYFLYSAKIQKTTENLLTQYLDQQKIAATVRGGNLHESQLGGLDFISLARGAEKALFLRDSLFEPFTAQLMALNPDTRGAWFSLKDRATPKKFSITSRTLSATNSIIAGRESTEDWQFLMLGLRLELLLCIPLVVFSAFLALTLIKDSVSPLKQITQLLTDLSHTQTNLVLPGSQALPESAELTKQINAVLEHNQHLIEEIQQSLDGVAHDLRTPMTRLRSIAEYALRAETSPDQLRDALADCLEESERVVTILNTMLSVAEAESRTMRLHREKVDLSTSITGMIELYSYLAEERGIRVELQCPAALSIYADRIRIDQVWANLLDNAIKYGTQGGWIRIECTSHAQIAAISIADNGIGISGTELPRIWERLYRGDRSRSQPGLGLGLNYVRAVVEAHDGTITVESSLNQGSIFTVSLPEYITPQ